MAVIWIIVGIFSVLSAVLLSGHGAFLIAGYNTASKKEKAKYDEKKLCRVVGFGMLGITVLMALEALLDEKIPAWFHTVVFIAILADIILMMYFANKKCYAENVEKGTDDTKSRWEKWSLWFTVIIFIAVGILLFTGNIHMEYEKDSFTIKATYWSDEEISYDDIEEIEYRAGGAAGSRVGGFGSPRLQMGNFNNREFGNYTRYTYTNCTQCVILTVNGEKIVISGKDEESTREIYEELLKKCRLL